MKFLHIFRMLAWRNIKLLIFYVLMSPFFLARLMLRRSYDITASRYDKFMSVAIGEIWMFGKNKIDFREIYEKQRRLTVGKFTGKNLLFFFQVSGAHCRPWKPHLVFCLVLVIKLAFKKSH